MPYIGTAIPLISEVKRQQMFFFFVFCGIFFFWGPPPPKCNFWFFFRGGGVKLSGFSGEDYSANFYFNLFPLLGGRVNIRTTYYIENKAQKNLHCNTVTLEATKD